MFTCELKPLVDALKAAKRVTGTRNVIPVLGYAEVSTGALTVTDLDQELTMYLPDAKADADFLLPVDPALKLLSGVKAGALVQIEPGKVEGTLTLRAGDLTADIDTLPISDFPHMIESTAPVLGSWSLTAEESDASWRAAAGCMSDEETRYYLRGINLCADGKRLTFVTTDGHRLAHIQTLHPYDGPPVIVPSAAVNLALALGLGACTLEFSQARVGIRAAGWRLVTKVVDGTFPDYWRVIPTKNTTVSAISAPALKDAASRIVKMLGPVVAVLDHSAQTLSASGTDGARRVAIDLSSMAAERGEGMTTTGYNAKYLTQMSALVSIFDDLILWSTSDSAGDPALIQPDAQPDFAFVQFVLMPMRF